MIHLTQEGYIELPRAQEIKVFRYRRKVLLTLQYMLNIYKS